jgi:xanthosine utilization system XapX-like protein
MFLIGLVGVIVGFFLGLDQVRMQATDRLMLVGIGIMVAHMFERRD